MAAVGDNNFMRYIYRGEEGEIIPDGATHITVAEDVTVIREEAFRSHPNIVEIICHDGVKFIERCAFSDCLSLRRVIMPGVKILDEFAFDSCDELTDVACDKLEIIKEYAFASTSLRSINMPSMRIVEMHAFSRCKALVDVKFGNKLERFDDEGTFFKCTSLERITIPLKDGIITADDIFQECDNLKYVDLIEGELHETIAALHLEEWGNDMNEEIDSINQILPSARAGYWDDFGGDDQGEKAQTIRTWIRSVLGKIIHYQAEHQRILNEAAYTILLLLPQDIVTNNVLPFLELPSHTFEVEEDEDNHGDSYSDESSSEGESQMEEDGGDER